MRSRGRTQGRRRGTAHRHGPDPCTGTTSSFAQCCRSNSITQEDFMAKHSRKRKARSKKKANHGKRPNS